MKGQEEVDEEVEEVGTGQVYSENLEFDPEVQ